MRANSGEDHSLNANQVYLDCLEILESKPVFLMGKELEKYTGYFYKDISRCILLNQRLGNLGIINVKGSGYVALKWIYSDKLIYEKVKRQVDVFENEALEDLRVASEFKTKYKILWEW